MLLMCVDDINKGAAISNYLLHLVGHRGVCREVNNGELNIVVVLHVLFLYGSSGQQEVRLVRRHLLEDHFQNRRLARFGHTHQTDVH